MKTSVTVYAILKRVHFIALWSHCFMYFPNVPWNHVFSRVSIILCAFPYTFIPLSVCIFCLLKCHHLRAVDGQIIVDTDHPVGPPSLVFKKDIQLCFGRYISVVSNLNALYLGFLLCTFMSFSCSAVKLSLTFVLCWWKWGLVILWII